jgi:DNA modification methylase
VEAIKKSLAVNGWYGSVVVNTGTKHILAGNHRVMAAKALGWETVPVQWVDVTPEEELRILVVDNRTTRIGQDDTTKITDILAELANTPIGLEGTGYGAADLDALIDELAGMTEPAELLTDPDEVPEEVETRCKPGDLWILGRHRLLCGDSTKADDVARLMDGAVAEIMVTDPPYGVEYDADWRTTARNADGSLLSTGSGRAVGKVSNDDRADWTETWSLFEGDIAYIWHAGNKAHIVAESLLSCDLQIRSQIIWAKNNLVIGRGDYHPQHEPCWYCVRKGQPGLRTDDRKQTTLWQIDKPRKSETGHSTQKPIECMSKPLENHTVEKVYDPFLGSGTTLIAAEQLGRKCYGMEISPKYCDVIIQRWENATGQKAVLDEG